MTKKESYDLIYKKEVDEKNIRMVISPENLLVALRSHGIRARFEKNDGVAVKVHTVVFKWENLDDKGIKITIFDGQKEIGYASYEYNKDGVGNLGKYYKSFLEQKKYQGFGIMTIAQSILMEVAKHKKLEKIDGSAAKTNLASINSRLNIRDLFTGQAYRTEFEVVTGLPNFVKMTTFL